MCRFNPLWVVAPSNTSLHVILLVLCFLSIAVSFPASTGQNTTIEAPQGTNVTNPGESTLLCVPANGIDLTKFFLFNYLTHALTVVSYPGESTADVIISLIAATLYPTSGAMRGLGSILRHSIFKPTDLQKAARSGALYMVVRSPRWKPRIVRMTRKDVSGEEAVTVGRRNVQIQVDKEIPAVQQDIVEEAKNLQDAENGSGVLPGEEGVAPACIVRDILVGEATGEPSFFSILYELY